MNEMQLQRVYDELYDHAAGMILHDLALYAIVLPAALAAWALWRLCSKPVRATLAVCALSLATLLLAVDIPDPREEITEAHRGLHGETQRIEWVEPAQTVSVDLTGFYLDLTRRPCRGATIHDSRFTIHANDCKE